MIKKYNDWLNESAFVNEEMVVFSYILHAYASDLIVDFEQIDTSYKDYFNNKSAGEFELKDIQEFFNVKPADIIVILGEGVPENVMNAFEDMIYLDGEGIAEDVTLVKLKRFNIDLLTDEIGQYIFIKKNDIEKFVQEPDNISLMIDTSDTKGNSLTVQDIEKLATPDIIKRFAARIFVKKHNL